MEDIAALCEAKASIKPGHKKGDYNLLGHLMFPWILLASAGTAVSAVYWRFRGVFGIFGIAMVIPIVGVIWEVSTLDYGQDGFRTAVLVLRTFATLWWVIATPSAVIAFIFLWLRSRQISN